MAPRPPRHLVLSFGVAALSVAAGVVFSAPAPTSATARANVDVLTPVFALPAHIVNQFTSPVAFAVAKTGEYVVLDRRDHAVFAVDADGGHLRRLLQVGDEPGRIVQPTAIALGGDDILAVADSPNGFDRIQYFSLTGMRVGGFYLPRHTTTRVTIEDLVLDGAGSLGFTGKTFLVNQPDWGGLFTEFDVDGQVMQQVGLQRPGPGTDRAVMLAMNTGIPIADPTGGFFFVFQAGVPMFRKYDPKGALVFERHIEGPELDASIQGLPTTWTSRPSGTQPLLVPLVRAAAVDRQGRLWISLTLPYTYVYDADGEKVRTVQFRAAGFISASSLFFTPRGRLLVGPGGNEFNPN